MSDVFNFQITKGEDYSQELLLRKKSDHEPIDITFMEFASTCRDHVKSELELFDFTFVKDPDPSTGRVVMSVARDITTDITPSAGVYDMFVTYTLEDRREPYMRGKITFLESQTDEV